MNNIKTLIIQPDGKTAKEVNPMGERPNLGDNKYDANDFTGFGVAQYNSDLKKWQLAEDSRKVYRIIECKWTTFLGFVFCIKDTIGDKCSCKAGSKVQAECNDEELTCIII
jgi:hypothetical protein